MPQKSAQFLKLAATVAARTDLTPSDKLVLTLLQDRARNGHHAVGQRRIARDLGMHRETVARTLKRLEAAGELAILPSGNGLRHRYSLAGETGRATGPPTGRAIGPPTATEDRPRHRATTGRATGPLPAAPSGHVQTNTEQTQTKRGGPDKAAPPPKPSKPSKPRKQKKPTDPRVKAVLDGFAAQYRAEIRQEYIVGSWPKAAAQVKTLLAQLDAAGEADPVGVIAKATAAMLRDPWGRDNATLGVLVSQFSRWRPKPPPPRRYSHREEMERQRADDLIALESAPAWKPPAERAAG